ncbi:FAD/FMN-containing dehydrogenase [Nitrobacteraceae bacterium AZCC 1564]
MIASSLVDQLRPGFHGQLLTGGDQDYEAARKVFNAMINRRPDLIARCSNAEDVARVVTLARAQGALVSVRGTGHNVAGYAVCDGGIVVDLSLMKNIHIDPKAQTLRAEPGLTWGEVNDALQPYSLAATGGFVSVTGVSGLTLGGGLGWLVRKHGLALDNLLSAKVVLADGRIVTANKWEHDDLFWAIRGGGGNFGVVTSFEFRVHPAGTVLAGVVVHPAQAADDVLRHWRDFETTSPCELTQGALLFCFPDDPTAPPQLRAAPVIGVGGVYAGAIEDGEKTLAPLRSFGSPAADLFVPTPYNQAQRMADFLFPPGLHAYWKSSYMEELSDAAIDVVMDYFARVPSPHTVVIIEHYGGALSRVPESETAFGHRNWSYNFLVTSAWSGPAETDRNIAWTREFFEAMRPFLANASYINYIGDEGIEGLKGSYSEEKFARLAAIKSKYDPTNLFRMNQNISPVSVAT